MWDQLSKPWQVCFNEAWRAYCNNSLPIGAAIVSPDGSLISSGRNMIGCKNDISRRITNSKLAHAEMNAIYSSRENLRGMVIYSTMEPCVMCFGAIVMNAISDIFFAARDGLAGGTNLTNDYIERRNIKVHEHHEFLEIVQLILKTDYILRYMSVRADELLKYWYVTCPIGIQMGREWHKSNKLQSYKEQECTIDRIIDEIEKEYETIWG